MKRALFCFPALFLWVMVALGQPQWRFVAGRAGIKVYSRSVADSKVKALKAECVLDAGAEEIVALLMDVKAAEQWVCHTKSCNLIRRISDTELYYHTEVSLPWPLDNRDFVTHLKVTREAGSDVVTVDAPAVAGMMPVQEGVVRISSSVNRWLIKPLPDDKCAVQYVLQVDPGGHIPAHVVNMFACQAPIETFQNMRRVLQARKRMPALHEKSAFVTAEQRARSDF